MRIIDPITLPEEGVTGHPEIKKRVMIRSGEIPQLKNFSRAVFAPGQSVDLHQHPTMYEVFYVLEGTLTLYRDGDQKTVASGQCLVIDPGQMHRMANEDESNLVLLYFGIATD